MRRVCSGIPVVGGICIGKVKGLAPRRLPDAEGSIAEVHFLEVGSDESREAFASRDWDETQTWAAALATTLFLTTALQRKAGDELGGSAASIFEAQQAIASDPMLEASVFGRVGEGISLPQAVHEATSGIVADLEASDDEAIRSRAIDVYDVGLRFILALSGIGAMSSTGRGQLQPVLESGGLPGEEGVLVAYDLLPSELVMVNKRMLLGLVFESDFAYSSVDVIAEALGVPTVKGAAGALSGLMDGETIIVDADNGVVILEPHEKELMEHASRILQTRGQTFYQATQAIMHEARKPPEPLS